MKINVNKLLCSSICAFMFLLVPIFCHAAALSPASIITAINQEREKNNLTSLITEEHLMQSVNSKLADMAAQKYFDHISPTGDMPWDFLDAAGYPYRASGENLAQDYFNTSSLINAWLQSDTHRANMLSTVFKDIGVAIGTVDGHTVIVASFGATTLMPKVAGMAIDQPEQNTSASIPKTPQKINAMDYHEPRPLTPQIYFTAYYILLGVAAVTIIVMRILR
ncbi:MAG: CAP domain-containing protein [Patescibacteria group bacterium]